ncbi:MAG: hypothetical protein FWB85_06095 [Chitinispirillia bacterium]|nr:hypothetical protein [Chitinispirillia bacterium]MCL2241796.1 hypothetical protein [Chitinispirillia bacterium]
MNKRPTLISALLACALCAIPSLAQSISADKPKIALYIVNDDLTDGQKRVLTAKILKPFTENGAFGVIDRSNIFTEKVTQERLKQHDGSVNDREIYRVGYESGAKYILMFDLVKFGSKYNVSARLVDVETAEIFGAQGETDVKDLKDISDAAEEVFRQITSGSESRILTQAQKIQARRAASRWLAVGAGTGAIPDKTAGAYSGAIPGTAGGYISGKFGGTWGESSHTWGVGLTLGGGLGSGNNPRVGAGINIYPFNDIFAQLSYGTAVYAYSNRYYDNAQNRFVTESFNESGFTLMVGYDYHINQLKIGSGHIMLSLAGGVVNAENKGWLPAYSAAVGWAFNY